MNTQNQYRKQQLRAVLPKTNPKPTAAVATLENKMPECNNKERSDNEELRRSEDNVRLRQTRARQKRTKYVVCAGNWLACIMEMEGLDILSCKTNDTASRNDPKTRAQ